MDYAMLIFLVSDPFMSTLTPREEFGRMMKQGGKETNTNCKQFQISVKECAHVLSLLYPIICHNLNLHNLLRMRHQSLQMSSVLYSKWLSVVMPEQLEPEFPYYCSKEERRMFFLLP